MNGNGNGKLTIFNTILGVLLAVLFGFLIRNVHQNAVTTARIEASLRHCDCAKIAP